MAFFAVLIGVLEIAAAAAVLVLFLTGFGPNWNRPRIRSSPDPSSSPTDLFIALLKALRYSTRCLNAPGTGPGDRSLRGLSTRTLRPGRQLPTASASALLAGATYTTIPSAANGPANAKARELLTPPAQRTT